MNKTTTRPPGRPKKTESSSSSKATTPRPKPKPTIKREEKTGPIEYRAIHSDSVLMIMQSGISVYDKDLDTIKEIRYCEREPSIYKEDQNQNSVKSPIIFRDGRLFVPAEKPNLRKFLDVYPGNKKNGGNVFYLVDKEKDVNVSMEGEFLVNDAISMLREKPVDDLLAVALGYSMDINRPISEIKHDLLLKAKRSPRQFMESFDNPIVAMKAKLRQAESYQIIKTDSSSVKWFDTNAVIISVPAGQDPIDTFTKYCLTEAAVPVVQEIDKQLA